MTGTEFVQKLRTGRLVPDDVLLQVEKRFGALPSATVPSATLLAEGFLTPFQVKKILAGDGAQLVLGQYRILDELGRGGMGQVFKAYHSVMRRTVAIKILAPDLQGDEHALKWFEREVRMMTQLQHPNIVLAYDANEVNGLHFLVMEYVEGENLQVVVKKQGPLSVPVACEMLFQAALALQHAQEMGIVHRDLKPPNLLVPAQPEAVQHLFPSWTGDGAELRPRPVLIKIADFGLARLRSTVGDTIQLRTADNFAGTPDFVSPEQCLNIHDVDIRSDLYSLGCTFYFALTGRVPFEGGSIMSKLTRHAMDPPPPLQDARPDIPTEVADLILRLMAKDPAQRFQTPLALARAAQPWCAVFPTAIPPVSKPSGQLPALPASLRPAGFATDGAAETAPVPQGYGPTGTRISSHCQDGPVLEGEEESAGPTRPPLGIGSATERVVHLEQPQSRPDSTTVATGDQPGSVLQWDALTDGKALEPGAVSPSGSMAAPAKTPMPSAAADPRTPATPKSPIVDAGLPDAWKHWTGILASVYAGQGAGGWDEPSYQRLHERLLAGSRQSAAATDGPKQALFRHLEELGKPWISLEVLARTEAEMLKSVLTHCRQVERSLGIARGGERQGRLLRVLAAVALVAWLSAVVGRAAWVYFSAGTASARMEWQALLPVRHLNFFPTAAWVAVPVISLACLLLVRRR